MIIRQTVDNNQKVIRQTVDDNQKVYQYFDNQVLYHKNQMFQTVSDACANFVLKHAIT